VAVIVTSKGQVQGGQSEVLSAPMVGDSQLHITSLRKDGEFVKGGDVVVQFDTADQEYKLKEAEADLAEAEQQVIKARADSEAQQEDDHYALVKAKDDVQLAQLDVRKNPLLAAIDARKNDLALAAARAHLDELQHDLESRKQTTQAAIEMQNAARAKAQVQAETARRNIDMMTLKAHHSGYVAISQNESQDFAFFGMSLPAYQVGDKVNPGMAVAQIPDTKNWEVTAQIGELDRGHIAVGQHAEITIVALPGRVFTGSVKTIGGMVGPMWNRRFDCRIALDHGDPALRPGMSALVNLTTDVLKNVLWVPVQAVFESDGRNQVYVQSSTGFVPRDVSIVRRSESQAVITGVSSGQTIALAKPDERTRKQNQSGGALRALGK
jgi:multidrug efflux pump subunit AcrA (membrane-fusion protein)